MQEPLHRIEKRLVLDTDVLNVGLRTVDSVTKLDNLALKLGHPRIGSVLQRDHGLCRCPWLRWWRLLSVVNKVMARGASLDLPQADHITALEIALAVLKLP